jgi:hypothetical protein
VRKEQLEGDFDALLTELAPSQGLFNLALALLRDQWSARLASGHERVASLQKELNVIDRKVDQLLDRIVDAASDTVAAAYEKRVREW